MSRVDVTRAIRFEIWAQGASGIPDLIGKCEARVSELLMMPGDHTLPITSRARFSVRALPFALHQPVELTLTRPRTAN